MTRDITATLARRLEEGCTQIGEIVILPGPGGTFELRHVADGGQEDLSTFTTPAAAREIATYDAAGAYRPLRTAPNLRRGWRLELSDIGALRTALDHFYPAMLGVLASYEAGELRPVPLRETLDRQTGMYAITRKLSDEQAQSTIATVCNSDGGRLKTILWRISPELAISSLPAGKFDPVTNQSGRCARAIPMLCHEACNILVAEARGVVKKQLSPPRTA